MRGKTPHAKLAAGGPEDRRVGAWEWILLDGQWPGPSLDDDSWQSELLEENLVSLFGVGYKFRVGNNFEVGVVVAFIAKKTETVWRDLELEEARPFFE